jgi:hypothetical protein
LAGQLISDVSGYTSTEFDTKIPSLSDTANIQEAFLLFHYGLDNYDGSIAPAANSLHSHLLDFDTRIDEIELTYLTQSSASSVYLTQSSASSIYQTRLLDIGTETASYVLTLNDANKIVEIDSSDPNTVTVPASTSVDFPIGTSVDVIRYGQGVTTITPGDGVTIRSTESNTKLTNQYSAATLYKRDTDEWILIGDLSS